MWWNKDILRGVDDWSRRAVQVGAKPWYASSVPKDDIESHRKELVGRRQAQIQAISSRQAAEREDRNKRQRALREIKLQDAKEKKMYEAEKKEERRIAKEKADIVKDERRMQAKAGLEEKAKEELIAKTHRNAERQAQQAEERQRKVLI